MATNQGFSRKVINILDDFASFPSEGSSSTLYFDKETGEMYYWNGTDYVPIGGEPLNVLTTVQPTPTATGNTTNLNSVFKDANGDTWIVDSNGDAIKAGSASAVETITTIAPAFNGFRYTNEAGAKVDVTFNLNQTDVNNQKIEYFVNGTKTFEFPLYTVNNDIQINNAGSEWDLTDDQITIKETNGDTQVINFPYRATVVSNPDGTIDIKQNGVTIGTIPAPTADVAYSKMLFVDPINGSDTTGTGSDNKMFQTPAHALTQADGSGYRIVLAAGTYTGNLTVSLPNIDIVTVAGSDRGNTSIQGTVTFTHTSSSSGIQGIAMTNLVHSGAGALYVTECQVNTLLNKTSTGYIEITDTQLQGTSTSTLSAGSGLIKDSLIKNMTISGASSGYTLKSNIIDADGTVSYTGGAFYNIQDNSGNINVTAGTNLETGLIASGLSSALAKQYVTDFSNKLGMLNPDSNATPTKFVTWNEATRRLEISDTPSGGALWYSGTNTPTATGNTAASLGVATLPANYFNTTTGDQFYIDANGVSRLIQKGFLTTSLTAVTGNGTSFVGASNTALATVADQMRLSDGSIVDDVDVTWTGHGLTVHAWYYLDSVTGGYTTVKPTSGFIQQLFFVKDANTIHIDVEQAAEVQSATAGATVTYGTVAPTGTPATGSEYFITSTGTNAGTITASYIFDGVNWILRPSGTTAPTGQNVYFDSENPATGTIFDTENPPVTNNDALKEDSANTYYGTDGSVWTWNGTSYVTKTYNFTTQKRNEFTATAGQTAFTISTTPIGQLYGYRNGIKLPTAWSWVGVNVTYLPAGNGGKTIDAGDVISFEYEAY